MRGEGGGDETFGDFEDLETGEKFAPNGNADDDEDEDEDEVGSGSDAENDAIDEQLRASNMAKKALKKSSFDSDYDEKKLDAAKEQNDLDAEEALALEAVKRKHEEQRERNRKEFGDDGEKVHFLPIFIFFPLFLCF